MSGAQEPALPILTTEDLLDALLPAYWLRPESALWYAHELAAVQRVIGGRVVGPSLEFGCLDGVNTFIMLGGRFTFAFDLYENVRTDAVRGSEDVFDIVNVLPSARDIARAAPDRFTHAIDFKESHLRKAAPLGIYDSLILRPLDEPLPVFADRLATIWAPMLFWVSPNRLGPSLREMARALDTHGRIVTILPDACIGPHLIAGSSTNADPRWIEAIDRGKYENFVRNAHSYDEWTDIFAAAGLRIGAHVTFASPVVLRVYDIGLRPLFPVLSRMRTLLRQCSAEEFIQVKRHWVDTCAHFLRPLCGDDLNEGREQGTWHAFELLPR
jgi:hypothetical protein